MGGVRIIPTYKDVKMTPFKTNQELQIEKKEREEKINKINNLKDLRQQTYPQQTLLKFELNQPQQMSYNPATMPQEVYPSPYVPVPNPYYPYAPNAAVPWSFTPNNIPVIKRYNISLGGPNGDTTRIANLYEDILPSTGNVANNSFNTLKERMIIHRYIRSIFVKNGDGEELFINGGKNNTKLEITNLLSHVKLLEINPYHFDRLTNNPYKTLPSNFVMYRSCYPVKMGKFNNVECSKSSIGINVRIYLLSKFDEISFNTDNRKYSDIWRELDYYTHIRDEIIKTNISPNFVCLHSYYRTKNTGINFKKFRDLKLKVSDMKTILKNEQIREELFKKYIIESRIDRTLKTEEDKKKNKEDITDEVNKEFDKNKLKYNIDSDNCLVLLTEATTQILYDWATKTYRENNGPIKKMIQSGYHDDKVWKSIVFQLLLSMLIMLEKDIIFTEFSIENNVYIKDLRTNDHNIGMWKYIYNGIEYFVPNYGYLLLIDSNFAEIREYNNDTIEYKPRILSTKFGDDDKLIFNTWKKQIIKIFDPSIFGHSFTNYGGTPPSEDFLNNLDNIKTEIDNIDSIDKCKLLLNSNNSMNFFKMIHNRIGTIVKDNETNNILNQINLSDINYGSIVVKNIRTSLDIFVLLIDIIDDEATIITTKSEIDNIINKDNIMYITEKVPISNLRNYYGNPEQLYEPGKQYNILETYLISRKKII